MKLRPPPGFVEWQARHYTWWLKSEWEAQLQPLLTRVATGTNVVGGRGTVERIPLSQYTTAVIRRYSRGGLVRHLVRDIYWDRPPRPFAELVSTETARRREVPTVEPLAAGVEWLQGGFYRGVFITREAEGFITLWDWLRTRPVNQERMAVLTTVAQAIAHLHEAGIVHADLNLTNILVGPPTSAPNVLLIDFDRARILSSPASPRQRARNLRRLRRSLNKLDPNHLFSSPADHAILFQGF